MRHRAFILVVALAAGACAADPKQYAPVDTHRWYRDALSPMDSPVDLRFLNDGDRPAGRHGFVRARGNQLAYEDGTPTRFWGGNLAAYALFAGKDDIQVQARRIAKLGYNLMRIHHHDSTSWVKPSVIDQNYQDSRHLDPDGLDRIDWWIKCLKDEGVYVWLDLNVGRVLKPADQIPHGFNEIQRRGGGVGGFNFLNPRVAELMKEFDHAYLSHVNRYTKLAYKDDPAVVTLLISNENDLSHHYGNLFLGDKGNPVHHQLFQNEIRAFAKRTGLSEDQLIRTWEPGASKLLLNDLEHRFNRSMLDDLRSIGVKVPVAAGQFWGLMGLYSLPSLTDGGLIDVHSYGHAEDLSVDPHAAPNLVHWTACAQVAGMPLTVSEWNTNYPAVDRFVTPLYFASIACLQGWDAPMIYNYSQTPFARAVAVDEWSTFQDVAITAVMPAAALAYRRGDVSPAKDTYFLKLDRNQTYFTKLDPTTSAALRTLPETSRLTIGLPDTPELDWDKQTQPDAPDAKTITDPNQDFLPPNQTFVQSDTGQLKRDWSAGTHTIDTPRTQAAQGWIGGRDIELSDVTISLTTPKATVCLSSLDGQPLSQSKRILLTTIARAVSSPNNRFPIFSEPVAGTIKFRSRMDNLHLHPLSPAGATGPEGAMHRDAAGYTIPLPVPRGTHWFLLTTDPSK